MAKPAPSSAHGVSAVPRKARMHENLLFMRKFFRHGITIASVWPSSAAMSRATIRKINWHQAKVVVELGAGTGPITEQIIRRLQPHTQLIAIERDHDFAEILRRRFSEHKNVEIVQADVRDLDAVLKARGVTRVDAFVSGLPTPSLPRNIRNRMLAAVRRYMAEGGVFFQYYGGAVLVLGVLPEGVQARVIRAGGAEHATGRSVSLPGVPVSWEGLKHEETKKKRTTQESLGEGEMVSGNVSDTGQAEAWTPRGRNAWGITA